MASLYDRLEDGSDKGYKEVSDFVNELDTMAERLGKLCSGSVGFEIPLTAMEKIMCGQTSDQIQYLIERLRGW